MLPSPPKPQDPSGLASMRRAAAQEARRLPHRFCGNPSSTVLVERFGHVRVLHDRPAATDCRRGHSVQAMEFGLCRWDTRQVVK